MHNNFVRTLFTALAGALALAAGSAPAGAGWNPDPYAGGVALTTDPQTQAYSVVAADGSGGTYVAWLDTWDHGVYVQHLNDAGEPLWTAGGVVAGGALASNGRVAAVPDGAGGVMVFWPHGSTTSVVIQGQRLDADGNPLWGLSGVAVTTASSMKQSLGAVSDGAGGAVLCWSQASSNHGITGPYTVRAIRVDAAGGDVFPMVYLGGGSGVDETNPVIAPDGAGGAVVVWQDPRTGADLVYAQRLSAAGSALWTAGGKSVAAGYAQLHPDVVSDGAGGVAVAWLDYRGFIAFYAIDAQRLDGSGNPLWTGSGVLLCNVSGTRALPAIASDGAGGAIVGWEDGRNGNSDIYARRITSAGTVTWTSNGVPVCTAAGTQQTTRIVADGAGGAILVWQDDRTGLGTDIYAQHLDAAGSRSLAADGAPVSAAPGAQQFPGMGWDGTAAVITWTDYRSSNNDVYAQRLDPFGYLGNPAPRIVSVQDIPDDQGGRIKVGWSASYVDADPVFAIRDYEVFRQTSGNSWLLVATVPYGPAAIYSAVVGSSGDTTGGYQPASVYRVLARSYADPVNVSWYSDPDSGYSADNLAPLIPEGLGAGVLPGGGTFLSWIPGTEPDLAGYRVYKGASEEFAPGPGNLLAAVTEPRYADPAGGAAVYKLTAMDVHGNESPASILAQGDPGTAADALPRVPVLAAPSPNPARGRTVLAFALPAPGHAALEVFDVGGRLVRRLADGDFPAGAGRLSWDLRDDQGRPVPAGVYTARFVAAGAVRTGRLVVVK